MRLLKTLLLGAALSTTACAKIDALDPPSGDPHTLVLVQGSRLNSARVIWDGTEISGAFNGATMFSVPHGAAPGPHTVVAKNSYGNSNSWTFTVTAEHPGPFPHPRIDAVTLTGAVFDNAGHVTAGLYVQGADIDVGAVVFVLNRASNTAPCPSQLIETAATQLATVAHKGLRNDTFKIDWAEFEYPIPHFLSTIAMSGSRAIGEKLCLAVRNLDALSSNVVEYSLPVDVATMDSDGDNLPDVWETNGYSGVDLPGTFKTDPFRRDILVQLDVMATGTATQPGLRYPPDQRAFDAARAMFDAAPFLNPNGPPGIHLVLDTHTIPYVHQVCFNIGDPSWCMNAISIDSTIKKFSDLKSTPGYFDNAHRDKIFHFGIWGDRQTSGVVTGESDGAIGDDTRGDDFLITFDWKDVSFQTVRSQAEGIVHELGHDLGLHHGGGNNDDNYVAAHWSVMSYSWSKRTGQDNPWRVERVTCPPMYYHDAAASEPGGALPATVSTAPDYSYGMGKPLSPPQSSTAPAVKTCGKAVDFRFNDAGGDSGDWRMLRYDGPVVEGFLP